jgi:DNA-binding beta-propeller fold protein YncE
MACGLALTAAPLAAQAPSSYHLLRKIAVGGEGGWDYVTFDTAGNRLFLSRGSHVMVVDPATDKVVGDIQHTDGVHGVAIAYGLGKGYTSNGRDTTVTVFDLKTLAPGKTVHVTGANPDAIMFEPVTKRVFTFNGRGQNATAIDATNDTVVGTVALGGKPETAVSDGAGHVFVNIEDKSQLIEFDAKTLAVLHTYPIAPCESPSGLAFDAARKRLFLGCENKMMAIIDANTGKVIATPATGTGTDANGFDPATGYAFSSNGGDGTLTIVQTKDAKFPATNVPTERGARTMTVDPKTHRVYLVTASFGPPPAATAANPRPRPTVVPNSFVVLVVGP